MENFKNLKNYQELLLFFIIFILLMGGIRIANLISHTEEVKLSHIEDLANEGKEDEAYKRVEQYLEDNPESVEALQIKAKIEVEREEYDKAAETYREINSIQESEVAYSGLAYIMRMQGEFSKATDLYIKATEINPDYAPAYNGLAIVSLLADDYDNAAQLAEKAYTLNDKDVDTVVNLAVIYHFQNNVKARGEMYERAKELGYENIEFLDRLFADINNNINPDMSDILKEAQEKSDQRNDNMLEKIEEDSEKDKKELSD